MAAYFLIELIHWVSRVLTLIVFIDVLLSYFMSPYHTVRMTLDRFVEPMLNPIRRLMPRTGAMDFSPIVLMLLIQFLEYILVVIISLFR